MLGRIARQQLKFYGEFESPDVLQREEVMKPTPNNNEVLIKIQATAPAICEPFSCHTIVITSLIQPKSNTLVSRARHFCIDTRAI